MIEVVILVVVLVVGFAERPLANLFCALVALALYEAAFVATLGATTGKLATGLRVVELDRDGGGVSTSTAVRRGLAVGALGLTLVPGVAAIVSASLSPLGRGFHDRSNRTFVVRARTGPVATAELVGYAVREQPPIWSAHGPLASFASRRRARASRLDDAPILVVALIAMMAALELGGLRALLLTTALWLVLFVVDETWRISRFGATAGHRREGLIVVDRRTGQPPGQGRALARALVLAPLLYIPPLQGILALWVVISDANRGPHDLVGGTVVVVVAAEPAVNAPPASPAWSG
ncbi:hypothetical protein BH24ACT3_BH24ACT3_04170 [soil metagenome]